MEIKEKTIPFNVKLDTISQDGIFEGSASDFLDIPDDYKDIIVKGAFKETLEKGGRNGNGVAMLWQHDSKQPIGIWPKITETDKSLDVVGQLALEVQKGKEAYVLMKMKALTGLSIGWDFLKDDMGKPFDDSCEFIEKDKIKYRYLKRLELWEISPVTFMANRRATITNVKSKSSIEDAATVRELERALRDAGLGVNISRYVAGMCKFKLAEKKNKTLYAIIDAIHVLNKKIH